MEHLTHFTLLSLGLLLGLVIWFWDSLKNRSFVSLKSTTLLVLVTFALLHASPISLLMAYHHQKLDHTTQHPCCMPQVATIIDTIVAPEPVITNTNTVEIPTVTVFIQNISKLHTRSPPTFS